MKYTVEYSKQAKKVIQKLDTYTKIYLKKWIEENLIDCENPRLHGKSLVGEFKDMWRYRVGNYRLIADISDNKATILVVKVGDRKAVYKRK
jgi:addiction module toxin, RelE/StbE family